MKLEYMMSRDIEEAKQEKTPLIIPVGTIEYHGPHCSLGCDTQVCCGLLNELEKRKKIVIAPPLWYGVSSYAVGGPEAGTINVDVDVFESYVYQILKSLLYGGFKNIYLLIHHQYEDENLMPMTLACMKASKKIIFEYLEKTRGMGWWGSNNFATYYENLENAECPWSWITVLPTMSAEVQQATGYDHAGKFECSILKTLYPEAVKTERLLESDAWFIKSASECSTELGIKMVDLSIADLDKKIN